MPGPKKPRNEYWSTNDAPMAEISGTSRGAFRRGRYAIRSTRSAIAVATTAATAHMMATDSSEASGLAFRMPVPARPTAVK